MSWKNNKINLQFPLAIYEYTYDKFDLARMPNTYMARYINGKNNVQLCGVGCATNHVILNVKLAISARRAHRRKFEFI